MKFFLMLFLIASPSFTQVSFDNIKNRQVAQFELTEIMLNLASRDSLHLLDRWVKLAPKSFQKLDFTKAYLLAGDKSLQQLRTNQALSFYVKSFQTIDKNYFDKVFSAYKSSLLLYAQSKRSEALFYINRAIEQTLKLKEDHPLSREIHYLKRRIVWRYFSRLDFLPDNAISAIEFDDDDVWIGMWSGAVARFNRSSSKLDVFNMKNSKLPSPYTRDILVKDGKIWVATDRGLAYYSKSSAEWFVVPDFNDMKLKIITYKNGYYYVGVLFRGVFRSEDGISWENIVPRHNVLDLLQINDELYIGTAEQGIFKYQNNLTTRFLPDVSAKTMVLDPNNRYMWVGTYGQGLLKIDRSTGKIVEQLKKDILSSDYIESLLIVDDTIWVGTLESGVIAYNLKSKQSQSLSLREGLPGLDITTITRENEFLWFGTLAGGVGIFLFQEQHPVQE